MPDFEAKLNNIIHTILPGREIHYEQDDMGIRVQIREPGGKLSYCFVLALSIISNVDVAIFVIPMTINEIYQMRKADPSIPEDKVFIVGKNPSFKFTAGEEHD